MGTRAAGCGNEIHDTGGRKIGLRRRILHGSTDAHTIYNVACTYSHLQMKKEALTTLKRAAEAGFSEWDLAARDTDLACLREEPEFKRMLERGK
ncbi:MAG: hypothetical protein DMG50_27520 [Acidobacteria bacterium]|nr:MAG: hypothetical protein DMG50_27520 [Acidobacteriota bacterium]